eukprot:2547290-Rhodomonas_salina.1
MAPCFNSGSWGCTRGTRVQGTGKYPGRIPSTPLALGLAVVHLSIPSALIVILIVIPGARAGTRVPWGTAGLLGFSGTWVPGYLGYLGTRY